MDINELKLKLCQFGFIHICKKDYVFTLYMTGKKLSNWKNVSSIQEEVLKHTKEDYPLVEAMHNDENSFLIILRPKTSDEN